MGTDSQQTASPVRQVVAPLMSVQTYKNLLYHLVAIPLALFYWTVLGFGLAFGVILSVVILGIVILLATVLAARAFAAFERWIANQLLAVDITSADDLETPAGRLSSIRRYLDAPSTWRGVGFVSLKFWFAIVGFLLVYVLSRALSMVSTIVRRPHDLSFGEVNGEPVVWTVETLGEVAIAVPVGIVLAILVLHLSNGFAYAAGRMAEALVGHPREPETG